MAAAARGGVPSSIRADKASARVNSCRSPRRRKTPWRSKTALQINSPLVPQRFLCLTRPCLGKDSGVLKYKNGAKKGVFRTAAGVDVVAGGSGQEIRAAPEERFVRRQHVLCHLQRTSEKFQKIKLNAERNAPTMQRRSLAHLLVAAVQEVAFQRDVEPV